jgi:hypothetical protein
LNLYSIDKKTVMLKLKLSALLLFAIVAKIFSQDCDKKFINYTFRVEICNNSDWEIEEKYPYLIIRSDEINVTINVKVLDEEKTPKEIWQDNYESEKTQNDDIKIVKVEHVSVDNVPAWFGMTYLSGIKSKDKFRRETYNIAIVYVDAGLMYYINNKCFNSAIVLQMKRWFVRLRLVLKS